MVELSLVKQGLAVHFEIRETLSAVTELHLLYLILRSENSLISILKVLLFRINEVKNFKHVVAQTMAVSVEGAKLT